MADDAVPPPREGHRDPAARAQGWRLAWPPLVFLGHFGAVYGWAGLACAMGWGGRTWGPMALVTVGVLLLTVLGVGAVWWFRPRRVPEAPAERAIAYDPDERAHFLATTTRMVGWLAAFGMLAVGGMSLVAPTCGPAA